MTRLLCLVFFLSGAAALAFETLWFRQAGLGLGNSVWASSLVLAGFMGGLAIGNGLAARVGHRIRRPLRLYASLELAIAVTGFGLVPLLPELAPRLAPLLRPLLDDPWLLNPLRLGIALALLLVPSTAMGMTLPLLVSALYRRDPHFGRVLGRLYGWNTLGAVVGALVGDLALIAWFGVRGTALFAALLNLTAAGLVFRLARRPGADLGAATREPPGALDRQAWSLLAAAFLAGGTLLALEVVWFRFLLLFVSGTSLVFSILLAIVLAGIGLGGLVGSRWLTASPDAHRNLPAVLLASGIACVLVYATFDGVTRALPPPGGVQAAAAIQIALPNSLVLGLPLMFPVSLLSGVLFTLIGEALHRRVPGEMRAAGLLTLANTTGAMLGALVAGFALLPGLGVEGSIRGLAGAYGLAATFACAGGLRPREPHRARALYAFAAVWVLALGLFPSGLMKERFLRYPIDHFARIEGEFPVETREGLTETIVYMRRDRFGEPEYYRMLTNGHSMSSTRLASTRYMKLFVYWPVAVHPAPRHALLISFGVGQTAKALTDTKELETIDVVDISKDVLEMNRIVYPEPADRPLNDPRVTVHVEDGRYFLNTTRRRFDLITGEPPPPRLAGIVNLYTREYFALLRERLAEGGIVTYWLPNHDLSESDSKAILRAFCDVFDDCSLWEGSALDFILVGTRDARGPVSEERFARQWRDPVVGPEMRALGFEIPEQMGALFMADSRDLRELTRATPPLLDDRPKRLSGEGGSPEELRAAYAPWMDVATARERYRASSIVERLWPAPLRSANLAYFDEQRAINRYFLAPESPADTLPTLHRVLTETPLETLALWLLGSSVFEQRAVSTAAEGGLRGPAVDYHRGAGALAARDYAQAAEHFARAQTGAGAMRRILYYRLYALCMAGRLDEARALMADLGRAPRVRDADRQVAHFLSETFDLRL